ncbi:uncharacterized protein BCR38DRAFT_411801 [Pseudomassariella vexata]|uniref:Pre-mRNA-splicing factor 38B n=1 Tax=Pseudomassariella vexata TaxID=1141098 RepID=A0A1Y2DND1_9PEZI|nr:uncharacterized protein BCR38DRAFT_411801 [Pseudomassariella vexata]ORY60664.1 hypothetical protein BCR38DRAFT_411801 [Pseudomassariella vexata]
MPPPDDLLTDDYVAELLAKEASDCSLKYSAMGLDAYNQSAKRPANQPKPNTRFLNHIIRDTNHHNRTLLARESAESKARLRDLENAEEKKQRAEQERLKKKRPGPGDTRKRMLGDIAAIIGGSSKKRKVDDRPDDESTLQVRAGKVSAKIPRDEEHTKGKEKSRDASPSRSRNARKELFTERDGRRSHIYRRRDNDERSRSRSTSRERSRHHDHNHKSSLQVPRSDRDADNDTDHRRHSSVAGVDQRKSGARRRCSDLFDGRPSRSANMRLYRAERAPHEASSDSDPLEDIIGPKPPKPAPVVRRRGRGVTADTSGINSRFASDYDPKTDVSLDDDDDWGSSLEALRDRQMWKQQGADKLRAAGFTDKEIKKWEKGGKRDEADVRWSKLGEQREWDRGKAPVPGPTWK